GGKSSRNHWSTGWIGRGVGGRSITQATPATSGGTNSGIMLTAAMKPLHGVLVRTTIQEKASPIASASAVPPPQAISELASASSTFGLVSTAVKLSTEAFSPASPSTTGL